MQPAAYECLQLLTDFWKNSGHHRYIANHAGYKPAETRSLKMRKHIASLLAAAGLAVLSGTAAARSNIDVGVYFGAPAPVYVAPRPVYYPAPVYSAPPPVYVAPAPAYYGPPPAYYYRPPVVVHDRGWHRGWRDHRHHGHHHR
jgi:hypothetical protein